VKIVWLASYPKSGNTWLRFLLYAYLYGPITCSADVESKIPAIHKDPDLDLSAPGNIIIKTHFKMSDGMPHLSKTAAFVYVLRDPRDVLLSHLNYVQLVGEQTTPEQYARRFIRYRGEPVWVERGFGTWPQHVRSWLATPRFPRVLVRYEQLKQDPHARFQEVLRFLRIPIDPRRVDRAVEAASFENMKKLETREKAQDAEHRLFPGSRHAMDEGVTFMNKGRSGQRLSHINPELDDLFDSAFGQALERLGYAS